MAAPKADWHAVYRSTERLFDAHLHIIDPRFPLVANQGYRPDFFTCADYRAQTDPLGVAGGAVVSASFQAFDQAYLVDALRCLGSGFVGVTQLPTTASDAEIDRLHEADACCSITLGLGICAGFDEMRCIS